MKIFQNLFKKLGFVPFTELKKGWYRAFYAGAKTSSLYSSWTTSNYSADNELKSDLKTLRARSRELIRNTAYGKKFIRLVEKNVVGANGIKLQANVKNSKGNTDAEANDKIEEAWKEWCKKGNCEVTGEYSFRDIQKMVIASAAGEGELLVNKVGGFDNDFNFALQLIEADHLDENHSGKTSDGNLIKMGIEYDSWNRKVAYHIYKNHPGDFHFTDYRYGEKLRIPAKDIIHFYIKNRISQGRGVPWMHPILTDSNMLKGYLEAELVASRIASSKMGFYENEDGEGYQGDDTESGHPVTEVEPGMFERLPGGWKFNAFDPQHPTNAFPHFTKTIMRFIATGLDVSYNYLSNDLEGVNYSSIRAGVLDERDTWRDMQTFLNEHFNQLVFEEWLKHALITKQINLPYNRIDKLKSVRWQARGWQWVDPLKDINASKIAIKNGLATSADIVAEQGKDYNEVIEQLAREKALRKDKGIITEFDADEFLGIKS